MLYIMNQTEVKEALDKAIISMDSVMHNEHQLPLVYTMDTLVHVKYLLEALRRSMSSEDDPMYDTPNQALDNIKEQAEFIRNYAEEIKVKHAEVVNQWKP